MENNNEEVEVLEEEQKTPQVNQDTNEVIPESNSSSDKTVAEIRQEMKRDLTPEVIIPEVKSKEKNFPKKEDNKKENISEGNKKETKKSSYILAIILFILLIVAIVFLPDINKIFSPMFNKEEKDTYNESSTGILRCSLKESKKNINYEYLGEFEYDNNKLAILSYTTSVEGKEEELSPMKEKCDKLNSSVKEMSGVSITCSLSDNTFVQNQILTYSSMKQDKVKKAYREANINYPNFNDNDEIDDIQKKLESSGYECKKESK